MLGKSDTLHSSFSLLLIISDQKKKKQVIEVKLFEIVRFIGDGSVLEFG